MITIYTTPSCLSCRKAKAWLEEQGLTYEERNLFATPLTFPELKSMLQLTEEGTSDIISVRSKAFQELAVDLEDLSISEFYTLVQQNPGLLRRPLIMDQKRLVVGYDTEEIGGFIPREVRRLDRQRLQQAIDEEEAYLA